MALPVADARTVRRYARELFRRHPRLLAMTLGLHALAALAGLATPRLLGDLVESISRGTSRVTVDEIALAIGAFVLVQSGFTRFAAWRRPPSPSSAGSSRSRRATRCSSRSWCARPARDAAMSYPRP